MRVSGNAGTQLIQQSAICRGSVSQFWFGVEVFQLLFLLRLVHSKRSLVRNSEYHNDLQKRWVKPNQEGVSES